MSDIARTPSPDAALFEIRNGPFPVGAPLTCGPTDAVVFIRSGSPLGSVGTGRHALHPGTLPYLAGAVQSDATGLPWIAADALFLRTRGAMFECAGPVGAVRDAMSNETVKLYARVRYGIRVDNVISAAFGLASMGDPRAVTTWFGDNLLVALRDHVSAWSEPVAVGDLAFSPPIVERAAGVIVAQTASTFSSYGLALDPAPDVQLEIAPEDEARWRAAVEATTRNVLDSSCVSCGAALAGGAKFCTECGARV